MCDVWKSVWKMEVFKFSYELIQLWTASNLCFCVILWKVSLSMANVYLFSFPSKYALSDNKIHELSCSDCSLEELFLSLRSPLFCFYFQWGCRDSCQIISVQGHWLETEIIMRKELQLPFGTVSMWLGELNFALLPGPIITIQSTCPYKFIQQGSPFTMRGRQPVLSPHTLPSPSVHYQVTLYFWRGTGACLMHCNRKTQLSSSVETEKETEANGIRKAPGSIIMLYRHFPLLQYY